MFRLTLSKMLAPGVEDGSILVYDKETDTLKGTKIVIKESEGGDNDEVGFPTQMLTLEGTPLGNNKVEFVVYDNEEEKMIYSNKEVKEIAGTPLGTDKIEYLAYDNKINNIIYSNKETDKLDIPYEGTPLGDEKVEYLAYNNATRTIKYSNVEVSPIVSGTPLGQDKTEYIVYDNATEKIIYSNIDINTKKYNIFATLKNDMTGINFIPFTFDNILLEEGQISPYNNKVIFPTNGIYKIEIILDCIVLNNIDLPMDVNVSLMLNDSTMLIEKIYSIKQIGETKLIQTDILYRFNASDELGISVTSSAIDKGITIKKSSSLTCYAL